MCLRTLRTHSCHRVRVIAKKIGCVVDVTILTVCDFARFLSERLTREIGGCGQTQRSVGVGQTERTWTHAGVLVWCPNQPATTTMFVRV